MNDLISRREAIDALAEMHCKSDEDGYVWIIRSDAWWRIETLPSAQPEIIRCKDCKNWERQVVSINDGLGYCSFHEASFVSCDGYCYWAERREDG